MKLANFSFQVEHSNFDDIASGVVFTMTVSSEVNLTQELVNGFTFCLGIVDSNEGTNFEKMVCSVVGGSPAGVDFTATLVNSKQLTFRCHLTAEYMATLASGFSGLPLGFYGELLTPVLIPDQSQIGSKVLWSNPKYVNLGDISSGAAGATKSFLKCQTTFTISFMYTHSSQIFACSVITPKNYYKIFTFICLPCHSIKTAVSNSSN